METTTYAMPVTVHGNGHIRSHSKRDGPQRLPLQPTTLNSGPNLLNDTQHVNEHKQHAHSQSLYTQPGHDRENSHTDHSRSRSHLPPPSLPPMDNATRPKGRRFSSGLPTHLKIQPNNYGYRSSSKPAYATSSEGSRRYGSVLEGKIEARR